MYVSTHSRPKAAGFWSFRAGRTRRVSTHSRPKAAGGYKLLTGLGQKVSTHSRPKAAGQAENQAKPLTEVSTHSRPKAAGAAIPTPPAPEKFQHTAARRRLGLHPQFAHLLYWFQHTAARRRLERPENNKRGHDDVSTHSRPKAAGGFSLFSRSISRCFNTQPPEGGWAKHEPLCRIRACFNTQPPEGGWP